MKFDKNMVTKDGKKLMHLIYLRVKEDCEDYDAIWTELKRRMSALSIPIINVDWPLYDDSGNACVYDNCLFYAQTFETGMAFMLSVLKDRTIRSKLDSFVFFKGDPYRADVRKYDAEDTIAARKEFLAKFHPDETW